MSIPTHVKEHAILGVRSAAVSQAALTKTTFIGTDLSGSDGDINRVLTLGNSKLTTFYVNSTWFCNQTVCYQLGTLIADRDTYNSTADVWKVVDNLTFRTIAAGWRGNITAEIWKVADNLTFRKIGEGWRGNTTIEVSAAVNASGFPAASITGTLAVGHGGTGFSTITDTYVVIATGADTLGSDSGFTFEDSANDLTVLGDLKAGDDIWVNGSTTQGVTGETTGRIHVKASATDFLSIGAGTSWFYQTGAYEWTVDDTYFGPYTAGANNFCSTSAECGNIYIASDKYVYYGSTQECSSGYNSATGYYQDTC